MQHSSPIRRSQRRRASSLTKSLVLTLSFAAGGINVASAADAEAAADAPPAEEVKKPKWETSAGFGLTYATGNSEQFLVVLGIDSAKKWDKNEVALSLNAGYGESEVTTVDASGNTSTSMEKNIAFIRGGGQYNRLFSERFYGLATLHGAHDEIADLIYRMSASVGAGYYFVKNDRMTLDANAGPGYVWEQKHDDLRDSDYKDDYATIRFGESFEYKLSERSRIWQSVVYLPRITDWSQFVLTFEAGIEAMIVERVALRFVAQDTYDSNPAPGKKENDLKLITSLNYSF